MSFKTEISDKWQKRGWTITDIIHCVVGKTLVGGFVYGGWRWHTLLDIVQHGRSWKNLSKMKQTTDVGWILYDDAVKYYFINRWWYFIYQIEEMVDWWYRTAAKKRLQKKARLMTANEPSTGTADNPNSTGADDNDNDNDNDDGTICWPETAPWPKSTLR